MFLFLAKTKCGEKSVVADFFFSTTLSLSLARAAQKKWGQRFFWLFFLLPPETPLKLNLRHRSYTSKQTPPPPPPLLCFSVAISQPRWTEAKVHGKNVSDFARVKNHMKSKKSKKK